MADHISSDSDTGSKPLPPSNGRRTSPATNGIGTADPHTTQFHVGHANAADASVDGLVHILRRQWHVVVLSIIAALVFSVLYLMITRPTYTSMAKLRVVPMDPESIASGNTSGANREANDTDFLETECVVIKSPVVLALAMDKIRDTRTLHGLPRPMDYMKTKLNADPAKVGKVIEVSFDSRYQEDATLIVSSVVDAYKEYEANEWKTQANQFDMALQGGTRPQEQALSEVQKRLQEYEAKMGFVPDVDPGKSPEHQVVQSLRDERDKAALDVMKAQSAYEQAAKAIIGHPDLVKAVDEAEEKARYSTNPEDQLKLYQQELGIEQAKLIDDSRNYLPNHPTIRMEQARVDQLMVSTVVAAKQWEESASLQLESIKGSLAEADKAEVAATENQREYIRLQREAENLKRNNEEVDKRVQQIESTQLAGALNISVLSPAEPTGDVKPPKPKTLAVGLVLGIIGGLALACVRDWTDDRMRTPQAIRMSIGAPVLGAIPLINTAYTAADRGQIVHHDPFGDAAESYRTLRTALQFGMPTGTKTLLVTSPVAGDGKSTFVSNLGIAMAQASRRVLIVDADLRAPTQHRIFGLKDRKGLTTVLGGGDALEQAIQRTEIEGLDLLPCGPTPSNPAEMLNSPSFADHLNDLADKYDLVILDSPPVTAVADSRILAASVDVSLMVIRLETSTRKQAEAARDGLRSVGARLLGIAVNGVPRNGTFGGASGYYPHSSGGLDIPNRPAPRAMSDAADPNL